MLALRTCREFGAWPQRTGRNTPRRGESAAGSRGYFSLSRLPSGTYAPRAAAAPAARRFAGRTPRFARPGRRRRPARRTGAPSLRTSLLRFCATCRQCRPHAGLAPVAGRAARTQFALPGRRRRPARRTGVRRNACVSTAIQREHKLPRSELSAPRAAAAPAARWFAARGRGGGRARGRTAERVEESRDWHRR